ncbi:MAG: hypothetical protein IJ422_05340 [Oscillospiraceae bacterium]|nr:hypothetical protein [Oscillospiraceae bacterium]
MDDSAIIQLFWERSESAITELSKKYGDYCLRLSANILPDRQDAQECVNDAHLLQMYLSEEVLSSEEAAQSTPNQFSVLISSKFSCHRMYIIAN